MSDNFNIADIDAIIESIGKTPDCVIPILQAIQTKHNYLPAEALERVCETTEITPAALSGVSTFYSQFRHTPAGRHFIKVCIGTACHVKGADRVHDAFKRYLDIPEDGDTDADRLFTVDKVACLGCCMLAPAVQIDDITYGFVEPPKVGNVLADFLQAQKESGARAKDASGVDLDHPAEIRLCLCSSCVAGGTAAVRDEFARRVSELSLPAVVKIVGCTGISYQTPLVEIAMPDGPTFRYGQVKPENVDAILQRHFKAGAGKKLGAALSRLLDKLYTDEAWEPVTRYTIDIRQGPDACYFGRQQHIAMEHCGEADPLDLDEYVKRGGFEALGKCLKELTPEQVIEEVSRSQLRGRGGAGFPTAVKWKSVRSSRDQTKYLICNGDEGDPGAFMDRMILESFPFRVIEGITIAGHAVGASEAFMYIRAEYPLAAQRVRTALKLCREHGYLGDGILKSDFSFKIRVVEGAGAFVCGEETALIAAVEGRRGMPRFRPPYPAQSGLFGKPTLVNNVETMALVPWIIRNGADAFITVGTEDSKGTKAFALAGKVRRGGLIEVPMGITIREVVDEIGGGIDGDKELKAVQVGGPSGGCLPASLADTPVDYHALLASGTMMGSGGMVVLDSSDCMVDIARYFMTFTQAESCGKCTACRVGTKRMLEILEKLCEGKARANDIETLEELAHTVKRSSLCGLGKTAPNPVLSTLRYFHEEYDAHVEGRCPAGKCKALIRYVVNDNCIGCTRCAQRCPADAIAMKPYEKHEIDLEKCTRCDTCRQACPADAIDIE